MRRPLLTWVVTNSDCVCTQGVTNSHVVVVVSVVQTCRVFCFVFFICGSRPSLTVSIIITGWGGQGEEGEGGMLSWSKVDQRSHFSHRTKKWSLSDCGVWPWPNGHREEVRLPPGFELRAGKQTTFSWTEMTGSNICVCVCVREGLFTPLHPRSGIHTHTLRRQFEGQMSRELQHFCSKPHQNNVVFLNYYYYYFVFFHQP